MAKPISRNREHSELANIIPDNEKNLAFIRRTITDLLKRQPKYIQGIVLFVFVILFAHVVISVVHGSLMLPTSVRVTLTKDEMQARKAAGQFIEGDVAYTEPSPGFHIVYNDYAYGLNSEGKARIDLSIPWFAWTLMRQGLHVDVKTPLGHSYSDEIKITGLRSGTLIFRKRESQANMPALQPAPARTGEGPSLRDSASLITAANAGTKELGPDDRRLFVRSITAPKSEAQSNATAILAVGKSRYPLLTISNESNELGPASILIEGGASALEGYRSFFALDGRKRMPLKDATIRFDNEKIWSFQAYRETFRMLVEPVLGKPTKLDGDRGGVLVVQLAYPYDVVLIERRDSSMSGEILQAKFADAGYAPRVNTYSRYPGEYNAVRSGRLVPLSILHNILGVLSSTNVAIKYIKIDAALPIPNQVEIGHDSEPSCLPIVDGPLLASLPQSEFEFRVRALASLGSC